MSILDPKPVTPAALDSHPRLSATALNATYVTATAIKTPTVSLIDTVAKAVAAGGGTVYLPPGTYGLGADLNIPNTVSLVGAGAAFTKIYAPGKTIRITGNSTQSFSMPISGVALDGVAVIIGDTTDDHCRGLTLRDVMIENITTGAGLTIRHNAVYARFENIRVRNCLIGAKHDFSAAINSGANISYINAAIHDCTEAGWWQDGAAADGWHTSFVNCDLEHNGVSYKLTSVGDGVLEVVNGHYELNTSSYVQADSGNIWINGAWMYEFESDSASKVAFFDLSGTAKMFIQSGRYNWSAGSPLFKNTGSDPIFLNKPLLVANVIGSRGANIGLSTPAAAGSTKGFTLPPGATASRQITDVAITPHGTSVDVFRSQPYDETPYEYTFRLLLSAAEAGNSINVFLNPGGVVLPLAVPSTATWAEVRVTWNRGKAYAVATFSNGDVVNSTATPAHALSDHRQLSVAVGGTGTATGTARNMIATALTV